MAALTAIDAAARTKMADDPKTKKPLYPSMSKGDKKPKAEEKPAKAAETAPAAESPKAAEGAPKSAGDKFRDTLKNLAKTHEQERRDMHGRQRDEYRQMQERHDKAWETAHAAEGIMLADEGAIDPASGEASAAAKGA